MNDRTVTNMNRIVVVKAGDTLASIAKAAYDDEALASVLARVNGMAQAAILTVGTRIKVPHRSQLSRGVAHKELGALPTDVPMFLPKASDGLPEITVTGAAPWWMDQKIWIAAGVGVALTWLLLSKHSPLKS